MPNDHDVVEIKNVVAASIKAMHRLDQRGLCEPATSQFGVRYNSLRKQAADVAPDVGKDRWPPVVDTDASRSLVCDARMIDILVYYEQIASLLPYASMSS